MDYRNLAYLVEPQSPPAPISRDPDDDHVLACALAARADIIVTGDLDLRSASAAVTIGMS